MFTLYITKTKTLLKTKGTIILNKQDQLDYCSVSLQTMQNHMSHHNTFKHQHINIYI